MATTRALISVQNVCEKDSVVLFCWGAFLARMTGMKQTMKRLTMDMPEIQRVSWSRGFQVKLFFGFVDVPDVKTHWLMVVDRIF